jgi:hypothetical protein
MATLKEIVVTVNKDATLVVEPTKGFSGNECLKATADLESALGKLSKRDPKPEMNRKVDVGDKTSIGS